MQIIELPTHRFFVGAQFHPEFKSRPGKPSPLFMGKSAFHLYLILPETYMLFIYLFKPNDQFRLQSRIVKLNNMPEFQAK